MYETTLKRKKILILSGVKECHLVFLSHLSSLQEGFRWNIQVDNISKTNFIKWTPTY